MHHISIYKLISQKCVESLLKAHFYFNDRKYKFFHGHKKYNAKLLYSGVFTQQDRDINIFSIRAKKNPNIN